MSIYQQNMRFPGHVPPPPTGYGFVHQPQVQMDPHTFRQFYTQQLAQLTMNSRPIIQNLSMMAQEYSRMAHVVAQCLETHTRLVPPAIKLPALYLLDAIAKNVPNPYAGVLSENVPNIFIDAYETVDPPTKAKMEEMLWTWRNGSPTNREVFGVVVQRNLENFVAAKHTSSSANPARILEFTKQPTQRILTRGQVLTELDVTIAQKTQAPQNSTTMNQIETLKQLHTVVKTTDISQEELGAIMSQLHSLNTMPRPPPVNAFPIQPPQIAAAPPIHHPNLTVPTPSSAVPSDLRAFLSTLAPSVQPQARPVTPTPPIPANLSTVLDSLLKAGVLSAKGTPSSGTPLGAGISSIQMSEDAEVDYAEKQRIRAYEESIMKHQISPSSINSNKRSSPILPFLHESQPYQCNQCALRFPKSDSGKQRMDNHLDMHFRQNSRDTQIIGRGHSRSWFIGSEMWVRDSKGRLRDDKAIALATAKEKEAQLKSSFVVVPPGDEAKQIACPVCKEVIKSEYSDDDEEWVWKNAVSVSGKIYHATCHADAVATPNALLSRIKQQVEGRSRSATPEIMTDSLTVRHKSRSPVISSSTLKRKAPETDAHALVKSEIEDSPAAKKSRDSP